MGQTSSCPFTNAGREGLGGVDAGRPVVVGVSGGQVSEGQTEAKPTGPCANPEREHRLIR